MWVPSVNLPYFIFWISQRLECIWLLRAQRPSFMLMLLVDLIIVTRCSSGHWSIWFRSSSAFGPPRAAHICPILKELHWLPVEQRITFKVLLLTFKALNNLAPPYLRQLIVPYNPTRNLRSAGKYFWEVPHVRLKSYGDRAFSVAAPKHWNEIPLDIKLSRSVDVFKSRIKTFFRLAFNWLFVFSVTVS